MSRCAACDKILHGAELYRKGWKYDMCKECIPWGDEELVTEDEQVEELSDGH